MFCLNTKQFYAFYHFVHNKPLQSLTAFDFHKNEQNQVLSESWPFNGAANLYQSNAYCSSGERLVNLLRQSKTKAIILNAENEIEKKQIPI